jgi:hypothetical protein
MLRNMKWNRLSTTGTMGSDVSFNTSSGGRVTQLLTIHGNPLTKYTPQH